MMKKTGQPVQMRQTPGLFVVVEGMDGAGKSTLTHALVEHFRGLPEFPKVVATREPTKPDTNADFSVFGELLEKSKQRGKRKDPLPEYWLFMLDREEHTRQVVTKEVDAGSLVICDRYYLSTLVYQGPRLAEVFHIPKERMVERMRLENHLIGQRPDICFVLDLDSEESFRRLQQRGVNPKDPFEKRELLSQYRNDFLWLAEMEHCIVLDASQEPSQILEEAIGHIEGYLPNG